MARTTPEYSVGDKKLPCAFDTKIVMRMFENDDAGILAFLQSYNDHKLRLTKFATEPTADQYKLAEMRKGGKKAGQIAREMGVEEKIVLNAIRRVAVWEYLKA